MDMDSAIRVMKYCIFAFAVTMFGLGHVMSGNGVKGWNAMDAQKHCDDTGAIGVEMTKASGSTATYLCQ